MRQDNASDLSMQNDIDPHCQASEWTVMWDSLKSKGMNLLESQHLTKDGRLLDMEIRCSHLQYGDQELVCAFANDITNRKESERYASTQHIRLTKPIDKNSLIEACAYWRRVPKKSNESGNRDD